MGGIHYEPAASNNGAAVIGKNVDLFLPERVLVLLLLYRYRFARMIAGLCGRKRGIGRLREFSLVVLVVR